MAVWPTTSLELKDQIAALQQSRRVHESDLMGHLIAIDTIGQRIDVLLERLADVGR